MSPQLPIFQLTVNCAFNYPQLEILRLVAEGYSNMQIAQTINKPLISTQKVIYDIYRKINLDSNDKAINPRVIAAMYYWKYLYKGKENENG